MYIERLIQLMNLSTEYLRNKANERYQRLVSSQLLENLNNFNDINKVNEKENILTIIEYENDEKRKIFESVICNKNVKQKHQATNIVKKNI